VRLNSNNPHEFDLEGNLPRLSKLVVFTYPIVVVSHNHVVVVSLISVFKTCQCVVVFRISIIC
jgi:hypothetical protein